MTAKIPPKRDFYACVVTFYVCHTQIKKCMASHAPKNAWPFVAKQTYANTTRCIEDHAFFTKKVKKSGLCLLYSVCLAKLLYHKVFKITIYFLFYIWGNAPPYSLCRVFALDVCNCSAQTKAALLCPSLRIIKTREEYLEKIRFKQAVIAECLWDVAKAVKKGVQSISSAGTLIGFPQSDCFVGRGATDRK